jgi:hypothetical protein
MGRQHAADAAQKTTVYSSNENQLASDHVLNENAGANRRHCAGLIAARYVWVQTSEGCSRLRDREVEWIRAGKPALLKLNGSQEYDFDGIKELHAIYEAQK